MSALTCRSGSLPLVEGSLSSTPVELLAAWPASAAGGGPTEEAPKMLLAEGLLGSDSAELLDA